MIAFAANSRRSTEVCSLAIGVFEDDALLLRLVEHSRRAWLDGAHAFGSIDSDDIAVTVARLAESESWEL
jgi:hypothetical protein